MARFQLKSVTFRRERKASWQELETLMARIDDGGLASLSAEELYRLPALYRGALSALSVARAISLDRNLLSYLESLAARAYVRVYGSQRGGLEAAIDFIVRRFPRLVRENAWAVVLAALCLGLGSAAGFALTLHDPELFYSFVSEEMAGGRTPAASREELAEVLHHGGEAGELSFFASFLFSHNARIGMLCFALGLGAGVPVVMLLLVNGLTLGAFLALYVEKGLGLEMCAWIFPHGVTELLALCLSAGAGFCLARAIVLPGRHSRLAELATSGRRAAAIALGAVGLNLIAALIEGFFRQLATGEPARFAMVILTAGFWAWYFGACGRER